MQMAKRADITEDKVLTDLQLAIEMAKTQAKPNELTNATMAQAKLVGLLRDRVEQGRVGEFDDNVGSEEILALVAAQAGDKAAAALAEAFGLEYKKEIDKSEAAANPAMDQPPPTESVN